MNNDDENHLNLLAIFHYVVAGITALGGCLPIFHLGLGIAILSGVIPPQPNDPGATTFIGWMFTGIAGAIIIVMWSLAIVILIGGRCLHQRRRPTFCLVVAGLECLLVPFGTVLGVFTIIVLLRPSVRQLFNEHDDSAVPGD